MIGDKFKKQEFLYFILLIHTPNENDTANE